MLGLLQVSLLLSSDKLYEAKNLFSAGFVDSFPEGDNNLDALKIQDFIIGLDRETADQVWRSYSRLLELWEDLQEESIPGRGKSKSVSEQEFTGALRLAKHNLEQLQK